MRIRALISFQETIKNRLAFEFSKIRESSLRRAEREEQRKYSHWHYRVLAGVMTAILVYSAYLIFDPGKKLYSLSELRKVGSGKYVPILNGKIIRADGTPPFSNIYESRDLSFDVDAERWPKVHEVLSTGKNSRDFWYSFDVNLSGTPLSNRVAREEIGVLVPKVFGSVTVFRDGERFDFRKDFRPIIGLTREINHFDIHVRADASDPRTPGISGFYPLVAGNFRSLDEIVKVIESGLLRLPLALAMQIVSLVIICALASAGPYMAELWPLIAFFAISIVDCAVFYLKETGMLPFSLSQDQYFAIKLFATSAQGFAFLWFVCEFFRQETKTILVRMFNGFKFWGCLQIICSSMLFRTIAGIQEPWIVLIVINYIFFSIATVFMVGIELCFVWCHQKTRERAILSSIIISSVYYFYFSGIYNYFHFSSQVTSEFAIQFNNYFVMAIITAIELGRNNRQRHEQGKSLPKESTGSFHAEFRIENYRTHSGFVVLCDGVGYSVKIGNLKECGPAEKAHFQCAILHFLLEKFYHPLTSNHSMTGDGFFFGLPMAWDETNLREVLLKCKQAIATEMSLDSLGLKGLSGDKMRFRCNLAYGEYSNSQVVVNNLGAMIASSDLHTYLARTAGSKDAPVALRVYLNSYTKGFESLPFGRKVRSENKSRNEQVSEAIEFTADEVDQILNEGHLEMIVRVGREGLEIKQVA